MNYSFRFFVSWIAAAIVMYVAFYCWHGLFLTDLDRLSFSKPLFLVLTAIVYVVVSFVLYKTYESKLLAKLISHHLLRGLAAGFIIGFILFAIVAVLGVSFTKHINKTYLIADCAWQIAEQMVGGIFIGLGKIMLFEPEAELEHKRL